MPVLMDHVIEGNLQNGNKIDFTKEKLAVHAFVKGQEVAQSNVDSAGHFKVSFASDEECPAMELCVTPTDISEGASITAVSEKLESTQFSVQENLAIAQKDLHISPNVLEAIRRFRLRYHMFGQVFAQTTFTIEPAPAMKMDFYECDLRVPFRPPFLAKPSLIHGLGPHVPPFLFPILAKQYLGTAYTDINGNYDFHFRWNLLAGIPPWLRPDPRPDILVRISQFDGATWKEVFRGPVDWNIQLSFHRDFLVPVTHLRPSPGTAPATGFAFQSIGLIPVDSRHLVRGYAFTDERDPEPVRSMTHRPFAETLRIGGLFARTPSIVTYKVQVAPTDENHVPGDGAALAWEDVTDRLYNLKWDPARLVWEHKFLGPDPLTHRFTNIETETNWFEPALKFTFNSRAVDDGFYAFRMIGFDIGGQEVGVPVELAVLCVDNTVPLVELEAPKAEKCGGVKLNLQPNLTHTLDLKVTAFDRAGHLLSFGIGATRGSKPLEDDVVLIGISPSIYTSMPGFGIHNQTETVTVSPLPAVLADCPTVSYNFELWAQGSATNGYSATLSSQWVRKDINLTVAEP